MKKLLFAPFRASLFSSFVLWGCGCSHSGSDEAAASDEVAKEPVASVRVVPLVKKNLTETVVAYGSVVAQPGQAQSVSLPYEVVVRRVAVAAGQLVQEGEALFEIEPSAATRLALAQAQTAASTTDSELRQMTERLRLKLATNQELGVAKKAASDAAAQLQNFKTAALGNDHLVRAKVAGVVTRIDVQDGQTVASGAPLGEVTAQNRIEVKLGVEPGDFSTLAKGQRIALFPVNLPAAAQIEGSVRLVTRVLNATTRLVDVYVSLPPDAALFLGGYVRGEIATKAQDALVVPRAALLPAEQGFTLFTVKNGHAVLHTVQTGLENEREIEVKAPDLQADDEVVVSGNYELEDGMAVATPATK